MKHAKEVGLVLVFFLLAATVFFRQYIFSGNVPLSFNLLVSFYSPWKYESIPGYPQGVPNKPIGSDIPKLFYPFRRFTTEQLTWGHMPLWNPYVFSGNVHAATYQSAVWYPLNFVYHLLPLADAWSMLIMLQPILAGVGLFFFLRSQAFSVRASLFGAISYAFSGWMIAWWEESIVIQHSILWLPWALLGSSLLWQEKRRWGLFILICALSLSIFAGFLQMSIYLFTTVLAWNIYQWATNIHAHKTKTVLWVFVAFGVSAFISALHWLPAFEAYGFSTRGTVKATFLFEQFLMPLTHLITFFAPDFWGNPGSYNYFFPRVFYHEKVIFLGAFPLLFALYALWVKREKDITFWKIFALIVLSLGFALPTSWIWHVLRVPILSVAQPSRIFALFAIGASVLAAYGLEFYLRKPEWKRMRRSLLFVTTLAVVGWVAVSVAAYMIRSVPLDRDTLSLMKLYATISVRNLVIPSAFLLIAWISLWLLRNRKQLLYGVVVIMSLVSSLYFANKFLYFSDRRLAFPPVAPVQKLQEITGVNRFWSYGNAYIEKNIPSYFNLYSPEGYDALFSSRYGELLYMIKNNGIITDQIPRTDVDLKPMSEGERMTDNPYRLRLMSLLGVKYVLETKLGDGKDLITTQQRFDPNLFSLVWENDRWRIWQYTQALPRAFFASSYRIEKEPQKIADELFDPSFDLRSTVILEQEVPGVMKDATSPAGRGTLSLHDYRPNEIEGVNMVVSADSPGFAFLSDTFLPGWRAWVDEKEVPVYRADYAFMAVPVPAGKHIVTLHYRPKSFQLAVVGSFVGITVLIASVIIIEYQRKKA